MQYPFRCRAIFFALTSTWSWAGWLLTPIVEADSSHLSAALFFLGGFVPSQAEVTVVAMTCGRRNRTPTHQGQPS
jgi:hypothetical protein